MGEGGSQWTCSTTRTSAGPSDFQSAAARWSALTSKEMGGPGWICAINLPVQSGALCGLSYGAGSSSSANRTCTDLSPIPAACVALNALAEFWKWSGTSVLPRVSRRSERRGFAVFLVPDGKNGATGNRTPIYAMPLRRLTIGRWPLFEKNWSARPDSHRVRAELQSAASTVSASRACVY